MNALLLRLDSRDYFDSNMHSSLVQLPDASIWLRLIVLIKVLYLVDSTNLWRVCYPSHYMSLYGEFSYSFYYLLCVMSMVAHFAGWGGLFSDPIDPLSSRKSFGNCGSYDVAHFWKQNNKHVVATKLEIPGCSLHEYDIEPLLISIIIAVKYTNEDVCTINGNISMKILLRLLESKNILFCIMFSFSF